MKLHEVIKSFFNFPLVKFDIWVHIFNSVRDIRTGKIEEESHHTKGNIMDRDKNLNCHQAKIDCETGTLVFWCSENDEDF